MTKYFQFNWKRNVPETLQQGTICDRWTEEKENIELENDCIFKVDKFGFFISWKSETKEGDVYELSTVNDIRQGQPPSDTYLLQNLRRKHGDEFLEKSVTICSSTDMVNVTLCNIIFEDKETADIWKEALCKITNNVRMNNVCPTTNLQKHWMRLRLTTTVDGNVSVKAIAKTFASGKSEKMVYESLADLDLPYGKTASIPLEAFTFEKFLFIYKKICPRSDIDDLFASITNTDSIPVDKLVTYMNEHQRDPRLNNILFPSYTEKRCMEIISMYEPSEENIKAKLLSKEGLTKYLMSDENAPVLLDKLEIYQEMNHPLCSYYINSSHNSYLIGRQFGGRSSVEIYRQILLSGCRCVELDCWDGKGKNEGEVVIKHGHAMCTEVLFKDVIKAISETAFVVSDYPLILSFENHCNWNNQLKMAKYCEEIFGDLLLKEPLPDYPLTKGKCLPPPNKLLRKILIKNGRLKPEVEKQELDLYNQEHLEIVEEEEEEVSEDPVLRGDGTDLVASYTSSTSEVHPLLSSMINYTQPIKFQGFDIAELNDEHFTMSSFAEHAALGYINTQAIEFVNYNKRQLSRIYPKGTRVDSSNFIPQIFWNAGCQLVALNFQTPDLPMQLNQGKFEYNGKCGYLLKPEFMRRDHKTLDPFTEIPMDGVIAAQCKVQVISGQFLSDKSIGTYVEVDMYGLPTDTIRKEFRTKVVPANGLNPIYNEEPFKFRKVVLPELALLRFGVYNEEGKLLGQRVLPFNDLQAGYRHISLRTESNFPMSLPMLFCNIELKIYVPDQHGDLVNALCDPRAFLSAQEKRAKQLKALGIEENDISKDVIESKGNAGAGAGGDRGFCIEETDINNDVVDNKSNVGAKKDLEGIVLERIILEPLQQDKGFVKVIKKHVKEFEKLMSKHAKERITVQNKQCKAIKKLAKSKKCDLKTDLDILIMINTHTIQWSDMMSRQRNEEWEMMKSHLTIQEEIFTKMFETAAAKQMKDLETLFTKELEDLMAEQTRISVETTKEVQNNASLKTKAEKDRRLKEKDQANTKKFIDERNGTTNKQKKLRKKQKKIHEAQLQEIIENVKNIIQMYSCADN